MVSKLCMFVLLLSERYSKIKNQANYLYVIIEHAKPFPIAMQSLKCPLCLKILKLMTFCIALVLQLNMTSHTSKENRPAQQPLANEHEQLPSIHQLWINILLLLTYAAAIPDLKHNQIPTIRNYDRNYDLCKRERLSSS